LSKMGPDSLKTIKGYRDRVAAARSISYSVGDRVRWTQKPKGDAPLATVTAVTPSGGSVRIRFDDQQREFATIEVWLDRDAILPIDEE